MADWIKVPDESPTVFLDAPEGLSGYWWETQHLICIPFIASMNPGDGTFASWIEQLQTKGKMIFFPTIISARLDRILRDHEFNNAFVINKDNEFIDGLAYLPKGINEPVKGMKQDPEGEPRGDMQQ